MTNRIVVIAKISLSAIFLAFCAVLPSYFSPVPQEEEPVQSPPSPTETVYLPLMSFSERAALFNANFNGVDIRGAILDESDLEVETLNACEDRLSFLIGELITDARSDPDPGSFGSSFITVRDDGGEMRLARFFREWNGDWRNWLDIIIDMDTLDIYYIYMSSSCLQNYEKYNQSSMPNHNSLLDFLISYTGYRPLETTESSNGKDTTATFLFGTDLQHIVLTYEITGHNYYYDDVPSRLFDYTIICKSDTNMMRTVDEFDATY